MDIFLVLFLALSSASCPKREFAPSYESNSFTLMDLPYDYYQLEPVMFAQSLYFHYKKIGSLLVENLNEVVKGNHLYKDLTITELLLQYGLKDKALARAGGGFYNHALFWWSLLPTSCNKNQPEGRLMDDIEKYFGSFKSFQEEFERRAVSLFGSGWIWLCLNSEGDLAINGKSNEYSPLGGDECLPFLGIDVWEHAYQINYQDEVNRWVQFWWQVVDWEMVEYWYEKFVLKRTPVPV
jgi:Fe-Mn family superoxide dismutase